MNEKHVLIEIIEIRLLKNEINKFNLSVKERMVRN